MTLTAPTKNPVKVRAGKAAALARWGPEPRILRLDTLQPPYRDAVLALLAAAKSTRAVDGG